MTRKILVFLFTVKIATWQISGYFASDISAGVLAIYSPPPIASHAMPLARPPVGYRKGNALRWRSVAVDCALLEGSASLRIGNWVPAQTGTPLMARGLVGSESLSPLQCQSNFHKSNCNFIPAIGIQFRNSNSALGPIPQYHFPHWGPNINDWVPQLGMPILLGLSNYIGRNWSWQFNSSNCNSAIQ